MGYMIYILPIIHWFRNSLTFPSIYSFNHTYKFSFVQSLTHSLLSFDPSFLPFCRSCILYSFLPSFSFPLFFLPSFPPPSLPLTLPFFFHMFINLYIHLLIHACSNSYFHSFVPRSFIPLTNPVMNSKSFLNFLASWLLFCGCQIILDMLSTLKNATIRVHITKMETRGGGRSVKGAVRSVRVATAKLFVRLKFVQFASHMSTNQDNVAGLVVWICILLQLLRNAKHARVFTVCRVQQNGSERYRCFKT